MKDQVAKSNESDDSLVDAIEKLTLMDDPTIIMSENGSSSTGSNDTAQDSEANRRKKLNEFLSACGKSQSIGKPKKQWQNMSMRAKKIHVSKAGIAITSALEVITPDDAGNLWQDVQDSHVVDKALGVQSPIEHKYLEALAETYQNATGCNTRKQVLATMADLVSLKKIQRYIPGLTSHRFEAARRHILQHGRGAPAPLSTEVRVRIDDTHLDHFLTFITSPHVVQDLPFGQRFVKLSDGRILETPNAIRSMIPSRICDQYRQYCNETGLKSFSTSTMRRILTVCPATVRKSLQGLDYFSADGAKAFDDLINVVSNLENFGRDKKWIDQCEKSLKDAKQYIKADYKV